MSWGRGRGHTPLSHTYLLPRPQSLAQRSPSPWQHSTLTPVTLLNIHMSIETPPSSPELNQPNQLYRDDLLDQSDVSRTKTSEWLKQVSIDANQSDQVSLSRSDSAKKSRRKKFVSGGLAERLHRIIQRENSEITFWEHRSLKAQQESQQGAYVYVYMYMYIILTCMNAYTHTHTHKK